ncbi:hypothetical protein AYI70_g7754 [Smittium culicis]|uniref:Uncharacterized protein n=1 Tax=Smittium culicis TaxID=133412 RepID=A0A1R1XJ36_9FUNG|nr:hypothetical protein AYI70_g7754 [Smittium culicis]
MWNRVRNKTIIHWKPHWGGGGSKKSLSQLRAGAAEKSTELDTAKFLDGIRVARSPIIENISDLSTLLNRCPVGFPGKNHFL